MLMIRIMAYAAVFSVAAIIVIICRGGGKP